MIDPSTMQAIKDGFSIFREALGLAKDSKALLPGPQQEAVGKSLERAEITAKLAEAQMAQAANAQLVPEVDRARTRQLVPQQVRNESGRQQPGRRRAGEEGFLVSRCTGLASPVMVQ
jgi:hypothetical protein